MSPRTANSCCVHHWNGLGVDGVYADADSRELVGGVGVIAEEGVFDVHSVGLSGEGAIQWSRVGGVFVKVTGIILGQDGVEMVGGGEKQGD